MKNKLSVVALAIVLVVGFISTVAMAAQTDPGFQAWLSRLDGSMWIAGGNQDIMDFWEIRGDVLTFYRCFKTNGNQRSFKTNGNHYIPAGTCKPMGPTIKVTGRRFAFTGEEGAWVYEISNDGLILTIKTIRNTFFPDMNGKVTKYVKEN